jgi:hypothetical protein
MPVRFRASLIHLAFSLGIALLAGCLVFGVWFPGDYRRFSGGTELFTLIVSVDVVLGPLLTLVVFNVRKPRAEIVRDLAVVGVLQLSALLFGVHTMYVARPVALVHEVDRFRVVAANQVYSAPSATDEARLSMTGPKLLSARRPAPAESIAAAELALQGYDIGQRPEFWQPYEAGRALAIERALPLSLWVAQHPGEGAELKQRLVASGVDPSRARFSPLIARSADWIVVLDDQGRVTSFAAGGEQIRAP